jgi:WD40 repeat protein
VLAFKAHKGSIHGIAFSPDGTRLATTAEVTRVWDLSVPIKRREFPNYHTSPSIAFSPNGRFLARGGNRPRVWNLETGKAVVVHNKWSPIIAFAPSGREVAVLGDDTPFKRWSLPSGKLLSGRWGGTREARCSAVRMAYSPDGKSIATVHYWRDGERWEWRIQLWNRQTGRLRSTLVLNLEAEYVEHIAYSPDGTTIAGTFGSILGVLNAKTGETVATFQPGKKLFRGLAFTPDGSKLLAVNTNDATRVYDTATWTETRCYEWKLGDLTAVATAPDGLRAACGSKQGRVVVWDLE